MMDIKNLASNPYTMRLAMTTSRYVPERIGHGVSWSVADLVSRFRPTIFQIVQDNLSHVLGPDVERQRLDLVARQVLYTTLRGYFDLFRALRLPREQLKTLVEFPEESLEVIRSMWNREGGNVLVVPHLGNFDLGGQAAAARLPEMQLITLPDPPPGFQLANKIRQLTGVKVTPLSSPALRDAIRLLQRGGTVSLAGDRPVSDLDEPVSFFGQPARVPSGHIRLALKTGAAVIMAYCVLPPGEKRYTMHFESPLEMIRTGDRVQDVQLNMRRVLDSLEAVIRRWPEQWQMYVPVWPQRSEA